MEKACELLRNRLDDLQEIEAAKTSFSGSALNSLVLRLKRQERLRVLRENEIMDALFSFKTAGRAERIAFESSSCELMKRLAPHFEFEAKSSGLYKDIASLYSSFYKHINNPLKVEEIRVINQNTTYHNFPFLCMLLKGIVQYAKGLFLQALSINSQLTQLPQPSTTTSANATNSNNNHNPHPKYYRSLTPPLPSSSKQTLHPQQHPLPVSPESKQQLQPAPQSSKFKSISQGGTSTTPSQSPINSQPSQVRDTSQQFPPSFLSIRQQQHSDDRAALSTSNPIKKNQSSLRFNGQEPSSSITPTQTFLGYPRQYPIMSKQKFLAYQQSVLALQPSQSFNAYNFTQANSAKNVSIDVLITQGHLSVLGSVQFSKRGYYRPIREVMDDIDCLQFKRNELLGNFYYKTMLSRNLCIARTIDFHRNCNSKYLPKSTENRQQGQPLIDENSLQTAGSADPSGIHNVRTQNTSPKKPLLIKSNSQSQICQTQIHAARSNNKNIELSILLQRESQEQELNPCRQSRTDVIHQVRETEDRGRFSCSNSERIIQNNLRIFSQEQRTKQIFQETATIESFNTERLICIKGLQNVTLNSGMNAEENTTFMSSDQIEKENCARVTVQNSLLSIIQSNSNIRIHNSNKQQSFNKLSDISRNNDKIKTLQSQYQQNKSKRALSLSCPEKDQEETQTQQPLTAKSKQRPTLLANIVDECQTKESFTQSKTNQSGQAVWRRSILTRNKPQQQTASAAAAANNAFTGVQDIAHLRCGSQITMETVKSRSRAISNGNVAGTQNKKQQSGYYFRGSFANRNNNQYHLHKQQQQKHQQYPISFDMLREFEEEEAQRLNQLSTQEPEQEDNKGVCPGDYEINNNHKTLPLYNITEYTQKGDVEGVLPQQYLLPVIPQPNIVSKKEQKQQQQQQLVYQQQSASLSAQQQQFLQSYRPSHSLENQSESAGTGAAGSNQHKNKTRSISYSSQLEAFNNQLIQRKDRLNGIILQQNIINDIQSRTGSSMRIESSLESYQSSKATTPMPGSARKRQQLPEDVILPSIA